jgi:hypothetical protein
VTEASTPEAGMADRLPSYPAEVEAVRRDRVAARAPPLYEMSVEEAPTADLVAIRAEIAPRAHTPVWRTSSSSLPKAFCRR